MDIIAKDTTLNATGIHGLTTLASAALEGLGST